MGDYLGASGIAEGEAGYEQSIVDGASSIELSLAEARDVYPEARKVLLGKASEEQVKNAVEDISAACRAGLAEACAFIREHLKGPVKLFGPPPVMTPEALENRALAFVALRARLGTNGQARNFVVVESAPYGMTAAVIQALMAAKYEPAKIAGHPIEVPYTFVVRIKYSNQELSKEQELAWARTRTVNFPLSPMAWQELSRILAKDAPKYPGYAQALARAHELAPTYWWPASELAWVRAQEGKFTEAEPLAKVALNKAPANPYALEASALVAFHLGRCSEAVDMQQRAVEKLPEPWPKEEHARFSQVLETYRRQCPAGGAPPAPADG